MISCPSCNYPSLAKHGLDLGTPIQPKVCPSCGASFHPRRYWFYLAMFSIGPLAAFLLALTLWRDISGELALMAGVSAIVFFAVTYICARRETPTSNTKRDRLFGWALVAALFIYLASSSWFKHFAH